MGARNRVVSAVVTAWLVSSPGLAADHEPGRVMVGQGNTHLQSPGSPHPPYNSLPPTSGSHVPWLARWGVHRIPIPWEVQVHNLEDGGVLVQYSCPSACPDLAGKLEALAGKYERLIVAPYPLMTDRITLTAWERVDLLTDYDEARITAFIDAYIGKDHHPAEGEGGAKPSGGKEKE